MRVTFSLLTAAMLLLVALVVLMLSACGGAGGGQEQANKARPLPEDPKALRPGEYRSEEFEPSLLQGLQGLE